MIKDNFLITGYGRSGTVFLSTVCNSSKIWNSYHEFHIPRSIIDQLLIGVEERVLISRCENYPVSFLNNVKTLYDQNHVGSVNGYLRYDIEYFDNIKYKAIIYRDLKDIMLSIGNRKPIESLLPISEDLVSCYKRFDQLIKLEEYNKIDFKYMVTDKNYLQDILSQIGILDVKITDEILKKKLNGRPLDKKYDSYDQLPESVKSTIESYQK